MNQFTEELQSNFKKHFSIKNSDQIAKKVYTQKLPQFLP